MSTTTVEVVALLLAAIAAARSTWSPCGLSMLSTLTPLGERSRGHRYPETVVWFVAGATVGGATLGGLMAALAVLVGRWAPSAGVVSLVIVIAAAVTIASDLQLGGIRLPNLPRQVNEVWTARFRGWIYASAFGWQIGVGVSTYVMTAAVYLLIVLAAMTGSATVALAIGTSFGLIRGLALLLGRGLATPEAIRNFHRRFEAAAPWSLRAAVVAQAGVVAVAVAGLGPAAVLVVAVAAVGLSAVLLGRVRHPARRPA